MTTAGTPADLQARLKPLFDATKAIGQLTTQLAKWTPDSSDGTGAAHLSRSTSSLTQSTSSLSPPGSIIADAPTDRIALAADIHQRLKDLEADHALLTADAADFLAPPARRLAPAAEAARLALATQLQRLSEDAVHVRAQFRRAQLQAKRTADAAQRRERAALFAGAAAARADDEAAADSTGGPLRRRGARAAAALELSGEDRVRDAASDVTLALRRTHQRMQTELQRSEYARATLQRSSAQLQQLQTSYGTLDGFLKSSRSFVATLRTSQKSDSWYLETALWILAATIAWLFFRRILYGPVRYLLYLPTKWVLQLLRAIVQTVLSVVVGAAAAQKQEGAGTGVRRVTASGKGPTRLADMPAPTMRAGGGGKSEPEPQQQGDQRGGVVDDVGAMAEAKQREEAAAARGRAAGDEAAGGGPTVLRERRPDEPVNPKKRMMDGRDEL